ncbi:MAG TPA: retropepsin-like aspartic protease [Candidatus Angelobacter sp.]|nr:retropepsin-like aspartic protease [Candidatus Angelobacter sp.]
MKRLSQAFCTAGMIVFVLTSALSAQEVIASAPLELRGNLPNVQVMVNGRGPFTFAIDTGAGGEALASPRLVEQLGLPVIGEEQVGDPSRLNGKKVAVLRIDSLKVAGVEFKNVRTAEFPSADRDFDGILGFPLFHDYLFTLDYLNAQMILARGSLPKADGNEIVPFTMPDNVPVIELTVGPQKIDAHVDSRGRALSVPAKYAADLKFVSEPIVIGRGRTVSNEFEIKGAQLASDVKLGGYTFTKLFLTLNPIFPIGNFGAAALRNFAVTFDQKNKLVRFVAKDKNIALPPPARPVGGTAAKK